MDGIVDRSHLRRPMGWWMVLLVEATMDLYFGGGFSFGNGPLDGIVYRSHLRHLLGWWSVVSRSQVWLWCVVLPYGRYQAGDQAVFTPVGGVTYRSSTHRLTLTCTQIESRLRPDSLSARLLSVDYIVSGLRPHPGLSSLPPSPLIAALVCISCTIIVLVD